jgi:formylglycine-generating enzyme required for sulfatase activity
MALIAGPVEFVMGSPRGEDGRAGGPAERTEMQHRRRIGRSFAIATKEVTLEQFQRFLQGHTYNKVFSPTLGHPVNGVSWYGAAAYCNWLSKEEGIPEDQWCYLPNAKGQFAAGMRVRPNHLDLTGYRLPTEAEWEFACRAGAVTSRYYGESEELLGRYAWYTKNSLDKSMLPPGSLRPNDLGLFDMLGNAYEWCQDGIAFYVPGIHGEPAEDKENFADLKSITEQPGRVLRGGSFLGHSRNVRAAYRNWYAPATAVQGNGVRAARTFH